MTYKVKFFYSSPRSLKAFESAIASNLLPDIDIRRVGHKDIPKSADLVVTTAGYSSPLERFAARHGAMPVVLPEAGDWLDAKVEAKINHKELVIVGYDLESAL